jgi:L-amino acid N-acyltransferase YncA
MLIRPATADDVPAIAVLGEKFHEEAGWGDVAEYVTEDCAATLAGMVENADAILLVVDDEGEIIGMAGAITFPLYFNAAHRSAQELFWYMKPGQRNGAGSRMLDTLENELRVLGCQSNIMIALDKVSPEATGRYYRQRGYRAAEHSWIRRL